LARILQEYRSKACLFIGVLLPDHAQQGFDPKSISNQSLNRTLVGIQQIFRSGSNASARSRFHKDDNPVLGGLLLGCLDCAWGKRVRPSGHDFRPTGPCWSATHRGIKGSQLGWRGSFNPRPMENMKKAFIFQIFSKFETNLNSNQI
jgi:hypothetical protein